MGSDEDDLEDHYGDDTPPYRPQSEIGAGEIPASLGKLVFFDETYLRMQAHNLDAVDAFLNQLEEQTLRELWSEDRTPRSAFFLSALTQMWIFAAYELIRTWRERVRHIVKLADNGGLGHRLASLQAKQASMMNPGRESEIKRLEQAIQDSAIVERAREDLRRVHISFSRLEFIRIALAKHEVRGREKIPARAPGYGRINHWCGSIEFELSRENIVYGNINRRDIAEGLRFMTDGPAPTEEDNASFDTFMSEP